MGRSGAWLPSWPGRPLCGASQTKQQTKPKGTATASSWVVFSFSMEEGIFHSLYGLLETVQEFLTTHGGNKIVMLRFFAKNNCVTNFLDYWSQWEEFMFNLDHKAFLTLMLDHMTTTPLLED